MAVVKRQQTVPYSPAQMYGLVNAIESYPDFVPACKEAEILSQDEDEIRAKLLFAHGAIHKSFTTSNRLQHNKMIEIKLLDGPFRHLEGFWLFEAEGENQCKIVFDLEFEFASRLLSFAFEPFFHQVTNKLVDVFVKRADEVYSAR